MKFLVESKRYGKLVKVSEEETPEAAFQKGEQYARSNLARSVIVVNESTGQKVSPLIVGVPADFRLSKRDRDILVQRSGINKGSPEVPEIQADKRRAAKLILSFNTKCLLQNLKKFLTP